MRVSKKEGAVEINRGCKFADLEELATEAKRKEGDILAARSHCPPPPAAQSIEPRCACNGRVVVSEAFRGSASAPLTDEQVQHGWELSDRALDPDAYAVHMAHANPVHDISTREHAVGTRPKERRNPERGTPDRGDLRSGRRGVRGPCYQCGAPGHIACGCDRTMGQEDTRYSENGRRHR
ncbi:hypothetical protein HPB51_016698 [Rhipicephalus microplus]|uniref:CCHC-type domain-containing protein n=1 Tax=Rhipicephalus microplus TaxID=6941 RepID=A0A9J6D5P7_RHIMP|nr:hypothetical protein HPB51_016698 [Rhipicephalus microplus]